MDLVEKTIALVEIPSITGQEAELCDYLAKKLSTLSERHEVLRLDNNLVTRPVQRRDRPLVALVGHLDTVPPAADNPVRRENDRLYGLGTSDMKAGVALMWHLLEQDVAQPAFDLSCVFYTGEEGPYHTSGLTPVLEKYSWLRGVDLAICLEPSDNVLQLGCLGTLHAEVTFRGRAAHSARPWHGENAIHKAAALIQRLASMQPVEVEVDGLIYREVISATLAKGGTARNVVPDFFAVNLNYRFAPGRSIASAQQRIFEIIAGQADVEFLDLSPSGPVPRDNSVLECFRRATTATVEPKQAWTDVARLAAFGIDAVNFGPGQSDQAHQPSEYVLVPYLEAADRLLRAFLAG